jgi:hypothetical protein
VVFWNALPANFSVRIMPEDCWIAWILVVRTHVYLTIWFQRKPFKSLLAVNTMEHVFLPCDEKVMKAEI